MFRRLGQLICRGPLICIGLWAALAVLVGFMSPDRATLHLSEPASLLPLDSPYNTALRVYGQAFPDQASRSQIVLVFHRPAGLSVGDRQFLVAISRELQEAGDHGPETWRVKSSTLNPFLERRLTSDDGQAVMIVVDLNVNFITQRATQAVEQVERIARRQLPTGLSFEITGSAGIGREHNAHSQVALKRTTRVTVVAVLVLLVLVYRSPLGALVPLVSIGLSVFIAFRVLDALALAGWSISSAERTFTVVLLFGAGTDYSLFWISRYREELSRGRNRFNAAVRAMTHVGPAILASAGTTIVGLMMLMSADMIIINNSGKVLGIVLSISLLAAMTLTPALAYVMGNAFFWPGRANGRFSIGQRLIWPRVARDVVRRPYVIFLCGLLLIGIPAISSFDIPLRYDSFGEIVADSSAARGLDLAQQHFSRDELFASTILLASPGLQLDRDQAEQASAQIAANIAQVEGVTDVWHLGEPLGHKRKGSLASLLSLPLFRDQVVKHYLSDDGHVLQFEVMQNHPPFSLPATAVFRQVAQAVETWAKNHLTGSYEVSAIGPTPYIDDVKAVADHDMNRVIVLVVVVIWLIVLLFVRKIWLAIFMLAATLLTYSAAIGLTGWLFVDILGRDGVDYKIKIFVFVVIVAVGQDYNIFLVTRMFQEIKSFSLTEAITRSIVLTGPVISSCGLIMAATLGSLSTTGIDMTEQLGFAFAAGILIDTFLVRPLLIPSFYLITEGILEKSKKRASESPLPKFSSPEE